MTIWSRARAVYEAKVAEEEAKQDATEQEWRTAVRDYMLAWGATTEDGLTVRTSWRDEGQGYFFVVLGYADDPNGLAVRVHLDGRHGESRGYVEGPWVVLRTDGEWALQNPERLENIEQLGRLVVEKSSAQKPTSTPAAQNGRR